MRLPLLTLCALVLLAPAAKAAALTEDPAPQQGIYNPLHGYFTEPTHDRFSQLRRDLRDGKRQLDPSGEIPLLLSLLRELEIPVSSQSLVYSVTSLQKALISPRRPRALYFNDDTYVGFVPGGRIEVISTDPQLGSIFYIFDPLRGSTLPQVVRSSECMNCHAPRYLGNIPALAIESVIPGLTGGGERAFRRQQTGHAVPITERFGGYHLTGVSPQWPRLWANLIIEWRNGEAREIPNPPGQLCDLTRYPLPTSDLLPQLLQEHQVGFVNRALQAAYQTRELLAANPPNLQASRELPADLHPKLAALAAPLVRYILFADEAPLPAPVTGDPTFRRDFAQNRRPATSGASLKDLDLQTRLFRYRCSYMVYTPTFTGLPAELKREVLAQLNTALAGQEPQYAYLPAPEKSAIQLILRQTLPDFPH